MTASHLIQIAARFMEVLARVQLANTSWGKMVRARVARGYPTEPDAPIWRLPN